MFNRPVRTVIRQNKVYSSLHEKYHSSGEKYFSIPQAMISGSWLAKGIPDIFLPNTFWLFLEYPKVFPGQTEQILPPVSSGLPQACS